MSFWQRLSRRLDLGDSELDCPDFWEEQANFDLDQDDFYNHLLDELYAALIVGPPGMGKSKLIEAVIQHLIYRQDRPCVVLLDPGAATAQQIERWALSDGRAEHTLIFDPAEEHYALAYNPLARTEGLALGLQAKLVQEAIFAALRLDERGRDSIYYAPMVKQVLYHLMHLLIETGCSLPEIPYLLASRPTGQAAAIIEQAKTEQVREFWQDLQKLSPSQRQQTLGLLQAELLSFVTSEPIQRMMALPDRSLNFSQFIEEGGLFIADLEAGTTLTSGDSKLLTNLLISSVVRACFARPPYTGREVHLILEEAGDIEFSSDISLILRRARKQRLRFWVLNQDLTSMRERDPVIFAMLWANITHRIAFGDLTFRDLELLAPEFYGEELNLQETKQELERTFFEPRESQRTITHESSLDSYAESYGEAEGSSWGAGESLAHIYSEEHGLLPLFTPEAVSRIEGQTHSSAGSHSSSHGSVSGHADVHGESTVPFYEMVERRELASREFWSLQEQLHRAAVKLKQLPKGKIALKRRGQPVEILKVPYIPDLPPPQNHQQLRERIFRNSPHYATLEEITKERAERTRALEVRKEEPENPTEF